MLVSSFGFARSFSNTISISVLAAFCASLVPMNESVLYASTHIESEEDLLHADESWVNRYFDNLDDTVEMDEVIDFVISLRASLIMKGFQCPSLANLCLWLSQGLEQRGIYLEPEDVQTIYEEILERETGIEAGISGLSFASGEKSKFQLVKHHHKKKHKKEFKLKKKGLFGFMKCIAGGLLCVVPGCQGVGASLVTSGIDDIFHEVKEISDENEKRQRQGYVPPVIEKYPQFKLPEEETPSAESH